MVILNLISSSLIHTIQGVPIGMEQESSTQAALQEDAYGPFHQYILQIKMSS